MNPIVLFEWSFSPSDYFEEAIEISHDNYNMLINDGKVVAKVDAAIYDKNPLIRKELHDSLTSRFQAVQALTHRIYDLPTNSIMIREYSDGHREMFIELESQCFTLSAGSLDIQITDKDESIVSDSRKDRIEKKKNFTELVARHCADTVLAALLGSYEAAVHDPNNELLHLYEIRDALADKFGKANTARNKLLITTTQWSRLGQLCNNEPLYQGRHRGKANGVLRDATESELSEARGIAIAMIKGYLQYIEATSN